MRHLLIIALAAAPLAACDKGEPGTTITLNASGNDGNMVAGVDGTSGTVSVNTPVFSGSLKLPKIQIGADNFEMNGVHLYPGSTISSLNIDARDGGDGKDDDSGTVHVRFTSPADPATVRDWFADKLGKAGFTLHQSGNGLAGTTDENKPFTLDLKPAGNGKAEGSIKIDG